MILIRRRAIFLADWVARLSAWLSGWLVDWLSVCLFIWLACINGLRFPSFFSSTAIINREKIHPSKPERGREQTTCGSGTRQIMKGGPGSSYWLKILPFLFAPPFFSEGKALFHIAISFDKDVNELKKKKYI